MLPWTPRLLVDQSCCIVPRTCYIACRRAPPPGIARRPCVSLRGNLLRNLPHDPASLFPSLRVFVRLSVRLSLRCCLYIRVCGSREPLFCSRTMHTARLALLFLPLRRSTAASFHQRRAAFSSRFSLLAVASMEREAPTAAHTCSHLSPDTGEGHGPAGSNEHASPYYRDFLI